MARKRTSAAEEPPKRRGRPPSPEGPREIVLTIRARREWKDWIVRFAAFCRTDMVDLVDDALDAYARRRGFEPPPRR